MIRFEASAATDNASRYLRQLCKHWSHKFAVEFDAEHGRIPFDADTVCMLDAEDARLDMRLEGTDPEHVERLTGVVTDHLRRFAFREDLKVAWRKATV